MCSESLPKFNQSRETDINNYLVHNLPIPQIGYRDFLSCPSNNQTNRDKPVGFYGPIAPPVPNAPELRSQHAGTIRISCQASCCCSSAIAGIAIGANFKIYLLRQFYSNRVEIFSQYTEDTSAKNDGPE